ncbi:NAD(P)-binding protein [Aspergillus taichungensis]|uniref:NAD(P)-binding protein n=1 Tax=Aspergillus taichungensis TaxID=482145 RepID=A0A2J5I445_9EURO|nr:NAD(P)-binding protein [Aspergillus taichungensis]
MTKVPTEDHPPTAYSVQGKVAIVTGAGSGISHALTKILLQQGCSVVMADLTLRPEAEQTLEEAANKTGVNGQKAAIFQRTDVSDWAQLQALFDKTIETYGTVNIVVNGAAIYEPPSSTFWQPPGVSPAAQDKADCSPGVYQTYAVNVMGPIRLAQIALNYWFYHPDEQMNFDGNLVWLSSVCGYVHLMQSPLYFSSKAAMNSMVKCLAPLRKMFGIRNAAVCPGPVKTPLFDADHCKGQLLPNDIGLTAEQAAEQAFRVMTEPEFGDGNIVEVVAAPGESAAESVTVRVRETPLEVLYPNPALEGNHFMEEEQKFIELLKTLVYVG